MVTIKTSTLDSSSALALKIHAQGGGEVAQESRFSEDRDLFWGHLTTDFHHSIRWHRHSLLLKQ